MDEQKEIVRLSGELEKVNVKLEKVRQILGDGGGTPLAVLSALRLVLGVPEKIPDYRLTEDP